MTITITGTAWPPGIMLRCGPDYGFTVCCAGRRIGWLFQGRGGLWVAEDATGEYLEPDFANRNDAIAALQERVGGAGVPSTPYHSPEKPPASPETAIGTPAYSDAPIS